MEFVGILHSIGEIESMEGALSFTKRSFFVKYLDSKNKEQTVKFVLYDPQLSLINNFEINQKIKIDYDFKGFFSTKSGKFFEEKIAISISLLQNKGDKTNKIKNIPLVGKIRPDFTKTFDKFPEELIY